jgi:hypothetical protein
MVSVSEKWPPLGEFEIRGEWWVPESPETRVSGVLRYKAGQRVKLELDKLIVDHMVETEPGIRCYSFQVVPVPIVLGEGRNGTAITMVNAYSLGFGNEITGSCLLIGRHFRAKESIRFSAANLNFTHLEVWSQHSPTGVIPLQTEDQLGAPFRIELPYRRKKLLDFQLPCRDCRIEIYSGLETSWHVYKSMSLKHGVLVYIEPSQPQNLAWYQQLFHDCVTLFSFFVGSRVYRTSTICSAVPDSDGDAPADQVEMVDQSRTFTVSEIDHHDKMPLPLGAVDNLAPAVFDTWFSLAEDLGPVYRLLMETLPPNELALDTTFLRLAQAAEVFYRRVIKRTYVEPERFEGYLEALVQALPADMPEDLRSRIERLPEARERLLPEECCQAPATRS